MQESDPRVFADGAGGGMRKRPLVVRYMSDYINVDFDEETKPPLIVGFLGEPVSEPTRETRGSLGELMAGESTQDSI